MGIWSYRTGESYWGPPALNISLMEELIAKRISARLCWSGEWGDTDRMPPTLSYATVPSSCALLVAAAYQLLSKLSRSRFLLWTVVKSFVLLGTGRDKGWTSFSSPCWHHSLLNSSWHSFEMPAIVRSVPLLELLTKYTSTTCLIKISHSEPQCTCPNPPGFELDSLGKPLWSWAWECILSSQSIGSPWNPANPTLLATHRLPPYSSS